jgi:hypothetical protein
MCNVLKKDIDKLNIGEYIVKDSEVHVKVFNINNGIQTFYCPFCKSVYDKHGNPTKDATPILHTHSYNPMAKVSKRVPHCGVRHDDFLGNYSKCFPDKYIQFCIHS